MDHWDLILTTVCLISNWIVHSHGKYTKSLCFPVIGDFGGLPIPPFTTWTQRKMANILGKVVQKKQCKFIVALGDNFYYFGVRTVDDPRFKMTFERTYTNPSLFVPWYIIAGNHDHISNVSAQIAYTKKSHRWNFPNFYHSKVFKLPGSDKILQMMLIDTTLLCWPKRKKHYPTADEQFKWIEEQLKSSDADYIMVAGHHPVLSAGAHGNTGCLVSRLKPLLEKYGVTAYFSGHDHNLQHIQEPKSKVHYFISGSGNFFSGWMTNKHKLPKGALKSFFGRAGMAVVKIGRKRMKVHFIDGKNGQTLYNYKLSSRK